MVVVYDLKTVRLMIRMYKKEKCLRTVARKMELPHKNIVRLVDWIWSQQEQAQRDPRAGLGVRDELSAEQYLRYLYTNHVGSKTAAAAVGWPEERMWRAVGGKFQWRKLEGRKPLSVRQPDPEYIEGDPTPDELEAGLAALREKWAPGRLAAQENEPHYEIPTIVTGFIAFD